VPLIAIQLSAIEVGNEVTINCVKVLDLSTSMGWEEDNTSVVSTDRQYWLKKATTETVEMADKLLTIVHEVTENKSLELNYNKHYIGLASGGVANNFISMKPRKHNVLLMVKVPRTDEVTELIEQSLELISYDNRWNLYQVRVTKNDLTENTAALRELISRASGARDSRQTED
jgi:coenzyme F420-reducing hydrogenase alpha subunit